MFSGAADSALKRYPSRVWLWEIYPFRTTGKRKDCMIFFFYIQYSDMMKAFDLKKYQCYFFHNNTEKISIKGMVIENLSVQDNRVKEKIP